MYIITILKRIISPQLSASNLENSLTYNSALDFSKYTILFHYETNSLNPSHVTKIITEVYVHIVPIHFSTYNLKFRAFLISVQLRNITPAIQYNSKEQEQRNLMTYGMLYGTKRQKDTTFETWKVKSKVQNILCMTWEGLNNIRSCITLVSHQQCFYQFKTLDIYCSPWI